MTDRSLLRWSSNPIKNWHLALPDQANIWSIELVVNFSQFLASPIPYIRICIAIWVLLSCLPHDTIIIHCKELRILFTKYCFYILFAIVSQISIDRTQILNPALLQWVLLISLIILLIFIYLLLIFLLLLIQEFLITVSKLASSWRQYPFVIHVVWYMLKLRLFIHLMRFLSCLRHFIDYYSALFIL